MQKQSGTVVVVPRGVCLFQFDFGLAKQRIERRTRYYILRQKPDSWSFSSKDLLINRVEEVMRGLLQQAIQKAIDFNPDMLSHFVAPPLMFLQDYDTWPGDIYQDECSITLDLLVNYVKSSRNIEWYLYINGQEKLVQIRRIVYDCDQMVEKVMNRKLNGSHF